jgi:hypothetical protein
LNCIRPLVGWIIITVNEASILSKKKLRFSKLTSQFLIHFTKRERKNWVLSRVEAGWHNSKFISDPKTKKQHVRHPWLPVIGLCLYTSIHVTFFFNSGIGKKSCYSDISWIVLPLIDALLCFFVCLWLNAPFSLKMTQTPTINHGRGKITNNEWSENGTSTSAFLWTTPQLIQRTATNCFIVHEAWNFLLLVWPPPPRSNRPWSDSICRSMLTVAGCASRQLL